MATKLTTSVNSKNQFIVKADDVSYTFNNPRGRDLATIERGLADANRTEAENLALVMATLSEMSEDDYLDLPLGTFKKVGVAVMEWFRLVSEA